MSRSRRFFAASFAVAIAVMTPASSEAYGWKAHARNRPLWARPGVDNSWGKVFYYWVLPPETCLDADGPDEWPRRYGTTTPMLEARYESRFEPAPDYAEYYGVSTYSQQVTRTLDEKGNILTHATKYRSSFGAEPSEQSLLITLYGTSRWTATFVYR